MVDKYKEEDYKLAIAKRMKEILALSGLELLGFAELLNKSASHIYGILNASRELSSNLAIIIGKKLDFDGNLIFRINTPIPKRIKNSKALIDFRVKYKDNPEYFLSTKKDRSIDHFIEYELLESELFKGTPKYLYEIRGFCKDYFNKDYTNDKLSKGLNHIVSKGLLQRKKQAIKKKDGTLGIREVDVFYSIDTNAEEIK